MPEMPERMPVSANTISMTTLELMPDSLDARIEVGRRCRKHHLHVAADHFAGPCPLLGATNTVGNAVDKPLFVHKDAILVVGPHKPRLADGKRPDLRKALHRSVVSPAKSEKYHGRIIPKCGVSRSGFPAGACARRSR